MTNYWSYQLQIGYKRKRVSQNSKTVTVMSFFKFILCILLFLFFSFLTRHDAHPQNFTHCPNWSVLQWTGQVLCCRISNLITPERGWYKMVYSGWQDLDSKWIRLTPNRTYRPTGVFQIRFQYILAKLPFLMKKKRFFAEL